MSIAQTGPFARPARSSLAVGAAALAACLQGCVGFTVRTPSLHPPAEVPAAVRGELKVHMKSGELYVLTAWQVGGGQIRGSGARHSAARDLAAAKGAWTVALDEVALLETNDARTVHPFAAQSLAVLTTVWGVASGVCVANPKSCFGSCPTFYAEPGPDAPLAEGFSSSIARALQERDVDALRGVRPDARGRVSLLMRNEALETQAVESVRLLAVPRPREGRAFATPEGRIHAAEAVREPDGCRAAEGNCLAALRAHDSLERASAADAEDLSARETLELEFQDGPRWNGLVLGARQTLLTTFLFYQSIAYAGGGAGDLLRRLETGGRPVAERALGMARLVGGIEAEVWDAGRWRRIGAFDEAGPLAADVQVLPFAPRVEPGPVRVRLRLAKGAWRVGYAALARLGPALEPRAVPPRRVERDGRPDATARAALLAPGRHLVTVPGDAYRLVFELPPALDDPELFLEAEGYYYEWQRSEWLKEEDPEMLALVLARPDEALRRLAGPFKEQEGRMEDLFWKSRFRR